MCSGPGALQVIHTLNHLKQQDRNFKGLVALIFLSDLMFYYLIFYLPNYLIALINYMIGSSYLQLCKKNSCSVKLQGRLLDHNPTKIPVEDSWIISLQNNSKCLLLNDKQMPHEILLSWQNTKHKKDEHTRVKRKEIRKKSKKNRVSCFNIYIVVFAFLSRTVEKGRC